MAKTVAERKAEQRKRQKELGVTKIELFVDNQELEMLKRNCVLRMPGREPYDVVEYLQMLIKSVNAVVSNYLFNNAVCLVIQNAGLLMEDVSYN